MSDADGAAGGTHQLHVGERDPALLLGNATLDVALRVRAHMFLHDHDVLNKDLAFVGEDAEHAAFLALVATGNHLHRVVPPDVNPLV